MLEAQSAVIPDGTARIPVFGTANKNRITVFKGAQLRVRAPGPTAQDRQYFSHTLVLAGDGPDGNGAFYYVKAAGGTLKLAAAESVPAASEVRCAGGTLDLNNLDGLTFATIGGFGSVVNGNVAANGIALTADEAKSGRLHISGSLTLPAAAPVRVDGVTSSFEAKKYVLITADGGITGGIGEVTGFESLEFPQLWRVTKSGNSILLTYSVGTALILR